MEFFAPIFIIVLIIVFLAVFFSFVQIGRASCRERV